MEHLIDGILFGMGFAIVNFPLELYLRRPKRRQSKKAAILKLVKSR